MILGGEWVVGDTPSYLVGGGPSLRDFNWNLLRNVPNVLVINRAIVDVPTGALFFTEDLRVIEKYRPTEAWEKFKGVKVFHALCASHAQLARALDPDIVVIEKKREDKFWSRNIYTEGLSYSSNSAVGAFNLLDILGADPIYLLGIDARAEGTFLANYHDDYPDDWKVTSDQAKSFKSDLELWVAPRMRAKITNLINPSYESALTCWGKKPISEHFE